MSRKIKNIMNHSYIVKWGNRHGKIPTCFKCDREITIDETFASIISSGVVKKVYCFECANELNII